jgi:hypothetical protein
MHGRDYQAIDYAHQYPSEKKIFHNWGLGAADRAVYPPGSVPQVRSVDAYRDSGSLTYDRLFRSGRV